MQKVTKIFKQFWETFSASKFANSIIRMFRYSATSVICLGISEATILILTATNLFGATTAALIANFAGVIPSYLLSRYWIWKEADRKNTTQQIILYWAISIISILINSFGTGFITHHSNTTGNEHLEVVGGSFLALNFITWIAKYVAYQKVVFKIAPDLNKKTSRDETLETAALDKIYSNPSK